MSDIKMGPPKKGETREKLTMINFKADQETLDNLRALEASATGVLKNYRRSTVIRMALKIARELMEKTT